MLTSITINISYSIGSTSQLRSIEKCMFLFKQSSVPSIYPPAAYLLRLWRHFEKCIRADWVHTNMSTAIDLDVAIPASLTAGANAGWSARAQRRAACDWKFPALRNFADRGFDTPLLRHLLCCTQTDFPAGRDSPGIHVWCGSRRHWRSCGRSCGRHHRHCCDGGWWKSYHSFVLFIYVKIAIPLLEFHLVFGCSSARRG